MLEWLFAPIDSTRAHQVGELVAWHARAMVIAWSVCLPIGVLAARYYKIAPKQKWPEQLDNKRWWVSHLVLQYSGGLAMIAGIAFVQMAPVTGAAQWVHMTLGWSVTLLAAVQFLGGWLRGSKGGPTAPGPDGAIDGDHYSMTLRRRIFEHVHKSVGYVALLAATATIVSGLWITNAPRWMWTVLAVWWSALWLVAAILQRRGRAIDTYQAIWGPDRKHPGNQITPIGWGIRRLPPPSK